MATNRRDFIERKPLAQNLPLHTPYTIYIDPSSSCNFKCNFCYHALDAQTLKDKGFHKTVMSMDLYKKVIDDIKSFKSKIRMLALFMNGEAFLNKNLIQMIEYAKNQEITDRIYIASNGTLLSENTNVQLANSGLSELLISVEALSAEEYEVITGVKMDFDRFIATIRHFYANRGSCKLYIKLVLYGNDQAKEDQFHRIFDQISDFAYTELVTPLIDGIDYKKLNLKEENYSKSKRAIDICPRPFFSLCVHSDGSVGCCPVDYAPDIIFGNVKEDRLTDIWGGKKINEFRRLQIAGNRNSIHVCNTCSLILCDTPEIDVLDSDKEKLEGIYVKEDLR